MYCTLPEENEQGGYSVRKEEGKGTVTENVIKMRDLTAGRQSRRLDAAEATGAKENKSEADRRGAKRRVRRESAERMEGRRGEGYL